MAHVRGTGAEPGNQDDLVFTVGPSRDVTDWFYVFRVCALIPVCVPARATPVALANAREPIVRVPAIQETAAAAAANRESGHRTTAPATMPVTKRKSCQVKYRQTAGVGNAGRKHLKEGRRSRGGGHDLSRSYRKRRKNNG